MSENQTADNGQQTAAEGGGGAADNPSEKTFTQAEVSKLMAKEKNQGRAAMLRELGIDPKDENAVEILKNLLATQKKADDGKQTAPAPDTEMNRKLDEITRKLQEADRRAFLADVKAEILQSGIQPTFLDDATTLILAKQSEDDFDLKEQLEAFKTKHPAWFAETQPQGKKGTGNPPPPGRDDNNKPDDLGARLAAQRKSGAVEKSHWA